ncbi:MAG: ribonuclease P protein component [bacterium]
MLSRSERLRFNGLFLQAYEKGKCFTSKNLKVHFTVTRETHKDRLPFVGFVVSKKFSKSAVIRNKYKRGLREVYRLFRLNAENAEKLKGIGLLVISLKNSETGVSLHAHKSQSIFNAYKLELEELLKKCL